MGGVVAVTLERISRRELGDDALGCPLCRRRTDSWSPDVAPELLAVVSAHCGLSVSLTFGGHFPRLGSAVPRGAVIGGWWGCHTTALRAPRPGLPHVPRVLDRPVWCRTDLPQMPVRPVGKPGVSLDITAARGLTKPSEVRHGDVCATSAWVSGGSLRLKGHQHWGFSDTSADAF